MCSVREPAAVGAALTMEERSTSTLRMWLLGDSGSYRHSRMVLSTMMRAMVESNALAPTQRSRL
jgi:hypothetical protein